MENNTYMRMYTWARKSVRRAYTCVDYILRKDPIRPTPGFTRWQDKGKKKSIFRIYSLYIYYKDDKKKKKQAIPYGIAAHTACGSKSAITKLLFRHLII